MGIRRDDRITSRERAQIAIEVLAPQREYGRVTELAREYGLSRQSIYVIGAAGRQRLEAGLAPGHHGPQPEEHVVHVDRNRLLRGVAKLTAVGVSQRDVEDCLEELLDTRVSPAWVNAQLVPLETQAAVVNARWQPDVNELLSGDEIFSNGDPNLLVIGNDSLFIYALARQGTRDGETWGCVLLDLPTCPLFASDAGSGLAAGVALALADGAVHQLDWDHLLRPLWGQVARREQQAYAALEALVTREHSFLAAHTPQRLAQHLAAWERLRVAAEASVARYDQLQQLADQVDAEFGLIDLATGRPRDPQAATARLQQTGQQLQTCTGVVCQQVASLLREHAADFLRYQPVLVRALAPLEERWGAPALQALCRLWQCETDGRRHPGTVPERQARQSLWEQCLDAAVALLSEDQLWQAWQSVCAVLGRTWRGSMLSECVNSLLRPVLAGRKQTDQGCLELFRFLHNVHRFARGKRADKSPAELVGIEVPDDPLTLLGLAPKVSI